MGNAKHIGRVGALAVALGVSNVRRVATRMTVSIGVAALVVTATAVPAPVSTVSPAVKLSADSTALIMGGTAIPTWNDADVEVIMNQFIAPTHPDQTMEPVAVTTPEEAWPLTGLVRLACLALCSPSLSGPGGPAWPDEPWWKLSGLFDLTWDQSIQAGVADLETAMAAHGNDHLVIYGYSQGAVIANLEKQRLAEQFPAGTTAPDIDFVLSEDLNLPNGGLLARFPGLYIPILDWTFDGPASTDTQFDTVEINRQYDGFADFPLYPLNIIADLNAILGVFYVHTYPFDVSLAPDASTSPAFQRTHGDTSYYFFETEDLPLFGPLRSLGVPESLIDVVEPFFRVLVELGYDRSISPWEPTPAQLIPTLDPATVSTDLVDAIGEGINNAAALIGSPPLLSIPAPVTLAAPATETAKADISHQVTATDTLTQTEQVTSTGTPVANMVMAAGPPESTAPQKPADPASVTETVQADVSPQVTPTETVTETSHVTSTKKVTETAKANEASTGPRATPNPSVSASTPKPAKPAGQPATPRPVVHGSLRVGEQLRDLPHHGNDSRQTSRTSAAGDEAATAGPSSVASSSAASSSQAATPQAATHPAATQAATHPAVPN
jgi:hypothetical protein